MAFTFDASPLSLTLNSYSSVQFADDYFIAKFGAESWASFANSKKYALLVSATNILDTFVYGGLRTNTAQPLQWPRQGIYSDEGIKFSPLSLPVNMIKATCEMAFWIWTEEDRMVSDITAQQLEGFKAGPLDLKISKDAIIMPPIVKSLISSIGKGVLVSDGQLSKQTLNMQL